MRRVGFFSARDGRSRKRLRDETRVTHSRRDQSNSLGHDLTRHTSLSGSKAWGPFGEPQTTDEDRETEVETEEGAKQRKRAQHREDEGIG